MIPSWNMEGILPPIWPGENGVSANRSPYPCSSVEMVNTFATSIERINILQGFLEYRHALYLLGIIDGFQWVDGSFMENIESQEQRPPNDIDVITYFSVPDDETQTTLRLKNINLFDHQWVKDNYKVDSYYEILGETFSERHVLKLSYWYSMWSHNRNKSWKGFLRLKLTPPEDLEALQLLQTKRRGS